MHNEASDTARQAAAGFKEGAARRRKVPTARKVEAFQERKLTHEVW